MLTRCLEWSLKNKWVGLLTALLIAALCLAPGMNLPIRLSLADLLPENRESVKDLNIAAKEVGGVGYLIMNYELLLRP